MKIAIVTRFPVKITQPDGGVESVSVNLVNALAKLPDCEIDVITQSSDKESEFVEEQEGYRVHRLPRDNQSELINAISTGRSQIEGYIKTLDVDVVHAHDTYGLMTKSLNIPKVFTIHGFIHGDTLVSGKKFPYLRSKIWKYFEINGWKSQPHIISISPYVRELVSRYVNNTVIHDIDNPISGEYFEHKNIQKRAIIFCAAAICPRKNQLALVKAVNHLFKQGVDVELRLAGPITNQRYGDELLSYIKEKNIGNNVALLGNLNSSDVIKELEQATIFSLLSLEENSPMGIEEAMAVGVPVVTSNRCGMPYMVKHGESGYLVDPNNTDDVAKRLRHILTDSTLWREMSNKGRDIALDRFHPDVIAQRTLQVYEECIDR
jgi:glycosyltransferase involved in cell wall biosynthesis